MNFKELNMLLIKLLFRIIKLRIFKLLHTYIKILQICQAMNGMYKILKKIIKILLHRLILLLNTDINIYLSDLSMIKSNKYIYLIIHKKSFSLFLTLYIFLKCNSWVFFLISVKIIFTEIF